MFKDLSVHLFSRCITLIGHRDYYAIKAHLGSRLRVNPQHEEGAGDEQEAADYKAAGLNASHLSKIPRLVIVSPHGPHCG